MANQKIYIVADRYTMAKRIVENSDRDIEDLCFVRSVRDIIGRKLGRVVFLGPEYWKVPDWTSVYAHLVRRDCRLVKLEKGDTIPEEALCPDLNGQHQTSHISGYRTLP